MSLSPRRLLAAALATATALAIGVAAPAQSAGPTGLPLDLSTKLTVDCITPTMLYATGDCMGDMLKSTYVEETVPKPGPYVLANTKFTWPDQPLPGFDTMQATGQTLPVPSVAGYRSVAMLCAFKSGAEKGNIAGLTVKYADGTSERVTFRAFDWKYDTDKSAIPGVKVQTLLPPDPLIDEGSISAVFVPVDPKRAIKAIVMPQTTSPALLVWAVSLSMQPGKAA